VNGVSQALTGTNTSAAAAAVFQSTNANAMPLIGALERAFQQGTESFIDEIQFSNGTIRDSNWIKLTYEAQRPASTALTLGATQTTMARPLFYPTKHAIYTLNVPISDNVPVVSGAASGWSIIPTGLPAGLTFNTSSGVVSGTPTAAAAQTQFIVNATVGGSPAADTITVTVSAGNPPGAPTNVTGTAGNSQVAVSWTAPLSLGCSAITGYIVRAVQDTTKTCAWTSGALNCTVTGLTNGTSYTFTVRAANSVGFGPASNPSLSVTPAGPPGPPTKVVAMQQPGPSIAVTLTWTAPASNGGLTITESYGESSPGGFLCYAAPPTTSCTITTGLTAGVQYTFRAYAVNGAGNGAYSDPSNPVTPVGIAPGSFAIQLTGSSRPFVFTLTPKAAASTEALTMSISDVYGRTVWSRTVNPSKDGAREVRWDGKSSTGRAVSAGVYMVRVSAAGVGTTSSLIRPAAAIR
jgi:hypothetical protein